MLISISVLGGVITAYALSLPRCHLPIDKASLSLRLDSVLLALLVLVAISGTYLVQLKGFTFHTPWVQAAYLLVIIAMISLGFIINKKYRNKRILTSSPLFQGVYLLLFLLMVIITHDAVTKNTLLHFVNKK